MMIKDISFAHLLNIIEIYNYFQNLWIIARMALPAITVHTTKISNTDYNIDHMVLTYLRPI